jgi:hypothetical protein
LGATILQLRLQLCACQVRPKTVRSQEVA